MVVKIRQLKSLANSQGLNKGGRMSYIWKVGELAVCINSSGYMPDEKAPILGNIYTVRGFIGQSTRIFPSLWFYELVNAYCPPWDESIDESAGYLASDFRPLDKSDYERIADKHKLIEPVKNKEVTR